MGKISRRLLLLALLAPLSAAACNRLSDSVTGPSAPNVPAGAVRWSNPASWPGGSVPQAGQSATIPTGTVMLLDVSPPALDRLHIQGTLVFDEQDLTLNARHIDIAGELRVGTEAHPFQHQATIVLSGVAADAQADPVGAKGLVVQAGALELHGQPRLSWTHLSASAAQGAAQLQLDDAVDWQAGDHIAIASTDFDPAQAEEAVVASAGGHTVALKQPLRFAHWGTLQTYAGKTLDERAEVGLLTRNIVVRGDSAGSVDGFGGHVMILQGAAAHIEGATFYSMGQKARLARYPIHWHMAADESGNYARHNSVWHSFNRCLTVHGTDNVVVQDNVCYDDIGHGYFLEDGIEKGNTFEHNLALRVRVPATGQAVLPSDATPAAFWITNPANVYRNNVGSGSSGFGFWVALPQHPTGLSTTASVWPSQTPLSEFSGNVAHSNSRGGLFVDDGPQPDLTTATTTYRPVSVPGTTSSAAVTAVFRNFTAYKHPGRGVWLRGVNLSLDGALLADNAIGATFAGSTNYLRQSVIVGVSSNNVTSVAGSFPIRGYEFYDGPAGAQNVTFINFIPGSRPASALGFNRSDAFALSPLNAEQGITLENANAAYVEDPHANDDGDRAAVFLDSDGSVTGTAGDYVVANNPFMVTAACTMRTAWNAWVCGGHYVSVRITSGASETVAPLDVVRADGPSAHMVGVPNSPGTVALNAPVGTDFAIIFRGTAPTRPRINLGNLGPTDWLRVAIPYANPSFVASQDGDSAHPLAAVASLAALDASTASAFYYDVTAGEIYIRALPRSGRTTANLAVDPK